MTRLQADFALFVIALLWGSTFIIVKNELAYIDPANFVFWRFLIASLALVVFFRRHLHRVKKRSLLPGTIIGFFLGTAYVTQTIGLQTTTAGKAGFITGISVVLVPIYSIIVLRSIPNLQTWAGVLIAFAGMGLLTLNERFSMGVGDLWVLACAISYGFQIVGTTYFVQKKGHDVLTVALVQVSVTCLMGLFTAAGASGIQFLFPWHTWAMLVTMGVVVTAAVFYTQTYVQRFTSPVHVALIFMLEPVFAALFAWWWGDETMTRKEIGGCGLILVGIVAAEIRRPKKKGRLAKAAPVK